MSDPKKLTIEHSQLERHIKRTNLTSTLISIVIGTVTALSVAYSFYFNTMRTLDEHSEDIKEVKSDVTEIKGEIKDISVFKGVSNAEIQGLQGKVERVEAKMDKMDDKLDKILIGINRK